MMEYVSMLILTPLLWIIFDPGFSGVPSSILYLPDSSIIRSQVIRRLISSLLILSAANVYESSWSVEEELPTSLIS